MDHKESANPCSTGFRGKFLKETQDNLKETIREMRRKCYLRHRRRIEGAKPPLVPKIDGQLTKDHFNYKLKFRRLPPDIVWMDIIRKIVLMISAYGAMQKRGCLLDRLTYRNVMEQYRVAVNTTALGVETSLNNNVKYNYKDYATSKRMSIPASSIKIMQKQSFLRTHRDIMTIYAIMMDLPIFQNYSTELRWSIARHAKYFKCEPKRVLTIKNRNPIRVYFIYSGTVNVVVEAEETSYNNETFAGSKKIISLKRGACIGHTAKTWLCICATNCEFLTIDKTTYINEGIDAVQSKEAEDRFQFFRKWPPLDNWSDNAVYDLANISYTESYPSGSLILHNQNEKESDVVWFVLTGRLDVIKVASHKSCMEMEAHAPKPKLINTHYEFLDPTLKQIIPKGMKDENVCFAKILPSEPVGHRHRFSISTLASVIVDTRHAKLNSIEYVKNAPIYIRMKSLFQGECYGLENVIAEKEGLEREINRFCLVSRDCVVIKLSGTLLLELINLLGIDQRQLDFMTQNYHDETTICGMLHDDMRWRQYKQRVVESQVLARPTIRKNKNFVSHIADQTHLAGTFNQAKYIFPQPVLRPGGRKVASPLLAAVKSLNKMLEKLENKKEIRLLKKMSMNPSQE